MEDSLFSESPIDFMQSMDDYPSDSFKDDIIAFGRGKAGIGAIIATIIGIVLIIAGYVLSHRKEKSEWVTVTGHVIAIDCPGLATGATTSKPEHDGPVDLVKACYAAVGYVVNGKQYTAQGFLVAPTTKIGKAVSMAYLKSDPSKIAQPGQHSVALEDKVHPGWFYGIGAVLIVVPWLFYALTKKSNVAAYASTF